MSLATDTDTPLLVIETRNGPRKFGALTMRDFARIQSAYCDGAPRKDDRGIIVSMVGSGLSRSATFYELIRWCQSAAGCVAVIVEAGAKFDSVYNEDQADADLTPKKMHRACIDILALSTETEPDNEGSADPNAAGPAPTPTG